MGAIFQKKNLPRGIGNFLLDKTLRYYKNIFDEIGYEYYKIEIDRQKNNINYVLRNPSDITNPFRVCLITFLLSEAEELGWFDDVVNYQVSLFYRYEVKETIREENILQTAIKKYGSNFKTFSEKDGFYKLYRWSDTVTEIELAFGHQIDMLKFNDFKTILLSQNKDVFQPKKEYSFQHREQLKFKDVV